MRMKPPSIDPDKFENGVDHCDFCGKLLPFCREFVEGAPLKTLGHLRCERCNGVTMHTATWDGCTISVARERISAAEAIASLLGLPGERKNS